MNICVIGLGKIGLPLAVHFAKMGNSVIGADINEKTVNEVNSGQEPFPEEENLQKFLSEVVESQKLVATTVNSIAVSNSEVVIVVVPLFVDKEAKPDFRAMDEVTRDIGKSLRKGMLVSYETTLPIGTTRERFLPVLEQLSGLKELQTNSTIGYIEARMLALHFSQNISNYSWLQMKTSITNGNLKHIFSHAFSLGR
jgi:nucleotide sugar dehydrogenase